MACPRSHSGLDPCLPCWLWLPSRAAGVLPVLPHDSPGVSPPEPQCPFLRTQSLQLSGSGTRAQGNPLPPRWSSRALQTWGRCHQEGHYCPGFGGSRSPGLFPGESYSGDSTLLAQSSLRGPWLRDQPVFLESLSLFRDPVPGLRTPPPTPWGLRAITWETRAVSPASFIPQCLLNACKGQVLLRVTGPFLYDTSVPEEELRVRW